MTIDEVARYFGNLHIACKKLEIASANMTHWKKRGYIPWAIQWKLDELSEGKLKRDLIDPRITRRHERCSLQAK